MVIFLAKFFALFAIYWIPAEAIGVEVESIANRFSLVGVIATGDAESKKGIVVVKDNQSQKTMTLKSGQVVPGSQGMWVSKIARNHVNVTNGVDQGTLRYGGADTKANEVSKTIVMNGEYFNEVYDNGQTNWTSDNYVNNQNFYEEDSDEEREALMEELRKRYTVFEPIDQVRDETVTTNSYTGRSDRTNSVSYGKRQYSRPLKYPHIVPEAPKGSVPYQSGSATDSDSIQDDSEGWEEIPSGQDVVEEEVYVDYE